MIKELTPIQALRLITGIFAKEHAVTILALVNLLARYLDDDQLLDGDFLKNQFEKIGIKLILEKPNCE